MTALFAISLLLIPPQDAGKLPVFEVASVRRAQGVDPENDRDKFERTPNSLTIHHATLMSCVKWAYDTLSKQVQVTGPSWIGDERYDIVAKSSAGGSESQFRLMLQALLAERFKMIFHRDKKETQVYALSVGRGGHKLRLTEEEGPPSLTPGRMSMVAKRMPMGEYASLLSGPLRSAVVDMTGLTGRYDFAVNLEPYMAGAADHPLDIAALIPEALRDQLGLKLESRKMPLDVIVIDRAEKIPTEN